MTAVPTIAAVDRAASRARNPPRAGAGDGHIGRAVSFLIVLAQFGLLYKVVGAFNLETAPFVQVFKLCVAAFVIHYWLPLRWKMPFFLALSLATIVLVFGSDTGAWSLRLGLVRGGWIVGIGVGLIVLCHAPIAWWGRVAMVALAGAGLAAARAGTWETPIPGAIWPILGAMFMFRLINYLYDLKHEKAPAGLVRTLAYFFMLPNACFPLFPVVDFKAFGRTHYDAHFLRIYQVGLGWILRGAIQLILYRVVYYQFYLTPDQVVDGVGLAQYLLATFLLYLRVSGQFHIIVGLLHMFGFNLPETHKRFYLASSFTDYWRRINIYWKDFIMKVVYYPAFFRLKRLGQMRAMAIATIWAFLITWLLHSYQWFWLLGRFPLDLKDVIFWGGLGAAVTVNALWEAKQGRARSLTARRPTARERLVRAVKTALTFGTICILWSLWNSRNVAEWAELWNAADSGTIVVFGGALLLVAILAVLPEIDLVGLPPVAKNLAAAKARPAILRPAIACVIPAAALFAIAKPQVHTRLGAQVTDVITTLKWRSRPAEGDQQQMERGYYEDLLDVGLVNSPLSEVMMKRPKDWTRLEQTDATELTGDFRVRTLRPSKETRINGVLYKTNRWGMRDQEYDLEKPPATCRIALLGASYAMGWGVENEQLFEALVEDQLNREKPGGRFERFEILNFAVNGYSPICQLVELRESVLRFKPDIVIQIGHSSDPYWCKRRLAKCITDGSALPDPFLAEIAAKAGVGRGTPHYAAERRIGAFANELARWAYAEFARECRAAGATPVWVFMPRVDEMASVIARDHPTLQRMAADAGTVTRDLIGVYAGADQESIVVARWDSHPNAQGHRMLADLLYKRLVESPEIGIVSSPASSPPSSGDAAPH